MKLPVVGTIYSSDRAGFLKLVSDANEHSETHVLVNVFVLGDGKIAALFRKREKNERGAFFGDDGFDGGLG